MVTMKKHHAFNELLRESRISAGLTRGQLARRLPGATRHDVRRWEEAVASPIPALAWEIERVLQVEPQRLMWGALANMTRGVPGMDARIDLASP